MGLLIEKYLGRSSEITQKDVERKFRGLKENFELEFKTIPSKPDEKDKRLRTLINPLVCFLNSLNGRGLLGLGIKTKRRNKTFEKIIGIKTDFLCLLF